MGFKEKIDPPKLPQHIAIIMDGNGRWAKKQGLMRVRGHEKGTKAVREVVEGCSRNRGQKPHFICLFYRELESSQDGSGYLDETFGFFS